MVAGVGTSVFLGDYVGVGAFARIYAHSEAPIDGKRMSGPMIPESMKGMITAPVRVEKDGLIGTGAVVLPGVTVGEGGVVAANSLVLAGTQIRPWTIWGGVPAKLLGLRKKVTVPDI
jgi:galactoside O-acetyltransferase